LALVKEKVLNRLEKEFGYREDREWILKIIDLTIQETSKQYENKIKELENKIEIINHASYGLSKTVTLKNDEIKQLKSKLKQQRNKIKDRIKEFRKDLNESFEIQINFLKQRKSKSPKKIMSNIDQVKRLAYNKPRINKKIDKLKQNLLKDD